MDILIRIYYLSVIDVVLLPPNCYRYQYIPDNQVNVYDVLLYHFAQNEINEYIVTFIAFAVWFKMKDKD